MLNRPATRRRGVTLLEVLTAIFIMAIGMLALLTLFPAGALSMARAVRDDRAAAIGANAAALAAAVGLRGDSNVTSAMPGTNNPQPRPVFVDPHYANLSAPALGQYTDSTGTFTADSIPRVTPNLGRDPSNGGNSYSALSVARFFVCQDEIEFDPLGAPANFNPTAGVTLVKRPGTYTLAYLVRPPVATIPNLNLPAGTATTQVSALPELTAVVFSRRNLDLVDGEQFFALNQTLATGTSIKAVTGVKGSTSIDISYAGTVPPEIRRRSWLLDVTQPNAKDNNGKVVATGPVNGFFYRVESVNDTPPTATTNGTLSVDVDRPLKEAVEAVWHFRDVVAVVERGTTWQP